MVQRDIAAVRLEVLTDTLSHLRRYRDTVTLDRLRSDADARFMVLHALYLAAQAAIDLVLHALADADEPTAGSYRDAFERASATGLLSSDLARRLAGWAGLRNVVAHQYPVLKLDLVHNALTRDLGDLEELAAAVATWIDSPSP